MSSFSITDCVNLEQALAWAEDSNIAFADQMIREGYRLGLKDQQQALQSQHEATWAMAMEAAANCAEWAHMVPPDGGSPSEEEKGVADEAAKRIRALDPAAIVKGVSHER